MGFLDSTTNNLIVDAVLTNTGRSLLARNDGSFSIHKFAASDDEVDYNIIAKYGRNVGAEKITKNTPVFEACTNQSYAQKFKLVSISNPNLLRLPSLSLSGDSAVSGQSNVVTLGVNTQKSSTLSVEQVITNESSIDVELQDNTFSVDVPSLFMQISNTTPQFVDNQQRAKYLLTRSANKNSYGGSTVQFVVSVKSLSNATFSVYGMTANKSVIKSYVRVSGMQSGSVIDITVLINQNL